MKFAERVEQRADAISRRGYGSPLSELTQHGKDFVLGMAKQEVIAKWAAANPVAMEALVEGTAMVIDMGEPTDLVADEGDRGYLLDGYFKRLDTPQEKK